METIDLQIADGVGTILLNRPQSLNAWNRQFGEELLDAVRRVTDDDAVRAVCVRGAGRAFSSGADLRDNITGQELTPEGHPDVRTRLHEVYHPIIVGLRRMPSRWSPPSTAPRSASGARSPSPATSSWPASRPTSCSPSSTSAWSPTAARRSSSPRARG